MADFLRRGQHETRREKAARGPTWYGMAIETLHLVLGNGHRADELSDAVGSLKWFSIPCHSGRWPIEVGEVIYTSGRVVR